MQTETVIVVAGGGVPCARAEQLPAGAPVIAADEGVDHALALGLTVAVAVGDFDSCSPAGLTALAAAGARVVRHPAEKDASDLELALAEAAALGPRRVLVVGTDAGRLDHALAGLLLLGSARWAGLEVDALLGPATVHVIRDERTFAGEPGELVSLLPLGGPATGVRTEGLAYALDGATLPAGTTRGVSNVFAAPEARVSLAGGVLLAIRPGREPS
ncbi:MAG: thiamine diphosphokinase [Gaiellaceae bacterium]